MTNATFTLPLKTVIELTGGSAPVVNGQRVYNAGDDGIGLEHYPIFDPAYRATLNGKIVDHYWNREIGRETVDDFQRALRMKMNEIMPYYNKLFESERLEYDALKTIDIRTIGNATTHAARVAGSAVDADTATENTSNNAAGAVSKNVASEMPGQMLAGNKDYATNASEGSSQTTSTAADTSAATSSSTTTEDAQEDGTQASDTAVSGYQGVPAELVMRYRESLLNLDMAIIEELEALFMGVWSNGDEFAGRMYIS